VEQDNNWENQLKTWVINWTKKKWQRLRKIKFWKDGNHRALLRLCNSLTLGEWSYFRQLSFLNIESSTRECNFTLFRLAM